MPICEDKTRDSNDAQLSIAEEECLRELPANPQWFRMEPNSFGDFGSELTKSVRSFIDPSRQKRKGRTVGSEVSAGFNNDFTPTSFNRLLQGFFFADARELPTTKRLAVPVGDDFVSAARAGEIDVTTDQTFAAGSLVFCSGFDNSANNGLKVVSAVASAAGVSTLTVTPASVVEAVVPGANKHVETVGYQFPEGDVSLAVTSGFPALISSSTDFTTLANFVPGAWLFIGGDSAATAFANNVGYARISRVSANSVVFDDVTFTPANESGAGKTLRVFVGLIIRNEKEAALIKQRSYQLERGLGMGENGLQAEYAEGCIANEFSLEFPAEEKIAADLSFLGCDLTYRSGDPGDVLKSGDRFDAPGEEVYNTTSDLYLMRISLHNPASAVRESLVGFASEGSLSITNNASPNKALSVLGALDFQIGDFEVSGSVTAYFQNIAAPRSIREDADASFSIIGGYANKGFVFDMPLLTISGGALTIEKDAPIMLPIEPQAVECEHGYTLLYQAFPYLPDAAMPD